MIRLNYIFHDCFFLETDSLGVVFDFWKDPRSDDEESPLFLKDFPESKPLYVLVSHFHKDHLNKCVFGWRKHHPNIHYIVSKDVRRHVRYLLDADSSYAGERVPEEAISVVSKGDVFEDSLLEVRAFGSTDIGNSYALIIKEGGLKVFHAGDLNCWTWRDESTEEEILRAEKGFLTELQPILQFTDNFDIAMFPVDSRIGTGYEEGAKIFLDKFSVKRFFPMHFTLGDTEEERARLLKDAVDFDRYRAHISDRETFKPRIEERFKYGTGIKERYEPSNKVFPTNGCKRLSSNEIMSIIICVIVFGCFMLLVVSMIMNQRQQALIAAANMEGFQAAISGGRRSRLNRLKKPSWYNDEDEEDVY